MATGTGTIRIGVSGSYGGRNLGDEAILSGIIAELRRSLSARITVFSFDPDDTMRRHNVERAVPVRDLTRREARQEVGSLDLLILGGGGILYDRDAEKYLREVVLALEQDIPVVVYAISAGPLEDPAARRAVAETLGRVPLVTVRDMDGYRLLEDVGVGREIHLTADPALLIQAGTIPKDALLSEGVNFDRPLVGFSVREPGPAAPDISTLHYYELLANAADYLIDRHDADIVFVPMEKSDVQHSHGVVARMEFSERAEILRRTYSAQEVLGLIGCFEFCVGMRLHFLIFSALQEVPFVSLPYASKVTGFIRELHMPVPKFHDVRPGSLISSIDRGWDTREDIRSRIKDLVPGLKERARRTNSLLLDVIAQKWGAGAFRRAPG